MAGFEDASQFGYGADRVSGRDGDGDGDAYQPAAPFGVGGLSDTVAVGAVLSIGRNVALTGVPALPAASRLAAYSGVRPGRRDRCPPPLNGQPGGSSANADGGTAGSSTQRVSDVPPGTVVGRHGDRDRRHVPAPAPVRGRGSGDETAVVGGVRSVNAEQVNARGVTMSDQPLSVPVSTRTLSATRTVQSPLVLRPFRRDSWPTGSPASRAAGAPGRGVERGHPAAGVRAPGCGARSCRSPVGRVVDHRVDEVVAGSRRPR